MQDQFPHSKKRFWKVDWQRYMVKRWHAWFLWRPEARKPRCKLNATVWEVKWWKWHNSWPKLGKLDQIDVHFLDKQITDLQVIHDFIVHSQRGTNTQSWDAGDFHSRDVLVLAISHMYISDFSYPWYADVWNLQRYICTYNTYNKRMQIKHKRTCISKPSDAQFG